MINGLYYDMPNRMNYLFERAPKNVRKIRYANADYKPSSDDIGWERLSASPGTYQFVTSFQNILDYPQTWLQELFIKLAQKNTALF